MRLRTKLVLTATGLTFAIVLVLSIFFLGELLSQRVEQTFSTNDVLTHEVLLVTRQAIQSGLRAHPPASALPRQYPQDAEASLHTAVLDALRSSGALSDLMNAIIRYSPTVQDVSVTDARGFTLVSTDEDMLNQLAAPRTSFSSVRDGSLLYKVRQVFGRPRVLDVAAPLDRNGLPFLVIHVGVRSTFLRNAYEPWLRAALALVLLAALASMVVAAVLSSLALRPLQAISEQLETLALNRGAALIEPPSWHLDPSQTSADPIGRVNRTIDRLGRQMRSREEGYTALQANLNQVLDTLRDGVLLFNAERRAIMVSDAVAHFLPPSSTHPHSEGLRVHSMLGMQLERIFSQETALGAAVLSAFDHKPAAFDSDPRVPPDTVTLEDGRQVQISLDRIEDRPGADQNGSTRQTGTLLTLRDTGSVMELGQELEVSRRLAAIGRLTANVGHEVKNPINAMVVHLELLRGKLAAEKFERAAAQKHVDILADEMHRLDRVVQTLADFSRPMDLDLCEHDLRRVLHQVLDLAGAELKQQGVRIQTDTPQQPVVVRIDAELVRQALLNLLLNAMQAMPSGGLVRLAVRREARLAVIEIEDDGIGISAAILPRIFDLYFTTKLTGSGIGLAMTYRILQLHGGALEVHSDADPYSAQRGTTFTLHLPIASAAPTDSRRPSLPPSMAAAAAVNGAVRSTPREDSVRRDTPGRKMTKESV